MTTASIPIPDAQPISASTCHVIAEAGQCMEGSVSLARKMADMALAAGCWGFKVQLLKPATIAVPSAPKYWTDTIGTTNQQDAFTTAGLIPYDDWATVKAHCDDIGIVFLATPFDLEAVDVLEDLGVPIYKLASGDITYRPLIERLSDTKKPLLLSTGAATRRELFDALSWFRHDNLVIPLACTLSYPTRLHHANLARISTLLDEFGLAGYSDHTTITDTALAAAAMGACILEKHFTWSNAGDLVPDHKMALDPDAMYRYVTQAHLGVALRGSGDLAPVPAELAAMHGARRAIVAARGLPANHPIALTDMAFLRPGSGVSPAGYPLMVGMRTKGARKAGDPLP